MNLETTKEKLNLTNLIIDQDSTKHITLLVTGACGFIGSNFVNYMHDKYENLNIINLDALYYCASVLNVKEHIRNSPRYKFIKGNVNSGDLVSFILKEYNVMYIIHFAAMSHVDLSFNESLKYTTDNVLGTHTLLECCRLYNKIKRFIHVSTDECFGSSEHGKNEKPKTEESILLPSNPYSSSKAAAEMFCHAYKCSYNMPIIITRGNNVFGPNQYPEKLIPKFIKLLKEDSQVTIQGDGSCVRSFLHVSDVVNAFDIILRKGVIGEIYNVGSDPEEEYSVLEIAKILIKMIKGGDEENFNKYIKYIEDRPFNDKRYFISSEKLKKLGWVIKKNFLEGLSELI
jgi:UDP-glucose 4,6-dehydratase